MDELSIIKNPVYRKMFEEVKNFLSNFSAEMTPTQINCFVLNDIEFPTSYGKFMQAKAELIGRYNQVVDLYFTIRKTNAKIDIKKEEIEKEKSKAKRKLLEIEKEELEMASVRQEISIETLINEAKTFFAIYEKYKDFDTLEEKEKLKLDVEQWAAKARNMPNIFEERYGANFMRRVFGEDYERYLENRRNRFGLLPRELLFKSLERNQ